MIGLLLLLASSAFGQQTMEIPVDTQIEISNLGKDTRNLLRGRYRQTGKPTFQNGICFGDGTCQNSVSGSSTGSFVSKTGDTMTGQLSISGSSLTVVASTTSAYSLLVTTAPNRGLYHLVVSTGGNVGIGTSLPDARLEIALGTSLSSASLSTPDIRFTTARSSFVAVVVAQPWIYGAAEDGSNQYPFDHYGEMIFQGGTRTENPPYNGGFAWVTGTALLGNTPYPTVKMRFTESGRLGIGELNPQFALHVTSGSAKIQYGLQVSSFVATSSATFGSSASITTFTALGFFQLVSRTKAQFDLLVPPAGAASYIDCSDCTIPGPCRSTGTLAAQWRKAESATAGCGSGN